MIYTIVTVVTIEFTTVVINIVSVIVIVIVKDVPYHTSPFQIKMRSESVSLSFSEPVVVGWPVQPSLVDKKTTGLTDSFPSNIHHVSFYQVYTSFNILS